MSNILLNKPATASDYYAPFTPAKAVDGVISTLSRWVSSKTGTNTPAWLQIDLQGAYCVNQYILGFMGSTDLWNSSLYNVKTFKIQGSMDGGTFFDLDSISNNSSASINKSFTPTWVRYLRVYITSGLNCNSAVSSVVDFQAFEPANTPFLSNLIPSTGPLAPAFSSRNLNYTINVPGALGTITFTPTALQSNMGIKVNGSVVVSGQASQSISLNPGNNTVTIEITSVDGSMKTSYTVVVIKPAAAAYLSSLAIKSNRGTVVSYSPQLTNGILNYSASVASGVASVILTPSAANSTILVNGTAVPNGTDSNPITLVSGTNNITIKVTDTSGGVGNYTIIITKSL